METKIQTCHFTSVYFPVIIKEFPVSHNRKDGLIINRIPVGRWFLFLVMTSNVLVGFDLFEVHL